MDRLRVFQVTCSFLEGVLGSLTAKDLYFLNQFFFFPFFQLSVDQIFEEKLEL